MASITNIINTNFKTEGADKAAKEVDNLTRATTRLGQSSAGSGRQFAAQASGLGGLVGAYAGAAATVFALQASFDALARSARALQTLEGLGALANTFGQNASDLLTSVRDITKGQLTIAETAQQINLSLSAGFNTEQIEGLAGVALKASRALGRDLSDSFTRVVRGSSKLETELLDELGIFTKIEPATAAYAEQLGKSRLALTEFERRQAFVNAVITEGERKFASINTTLPTTAEQIEAFGVKILDIATQIGGFIAQTLAPLASYLTNNLAGAFAAVGTVAGLVAAKGITVLKGKLDEFADTAVRRGATVENFFLRYSAAAKKAREAAQQDIAGINLQKGVGGESQAQLKALKEAAKTRTLTGSEIQQGIKLLSEREAKLKSIRASEEARLRDLDSENQRLKQNTAGLDAASAQYKSTMIEIARNTDAIVKQTKALETTDTRIKQTTTSLKTLQTSAAGATSGLAKLASTAVTGFISLGSSVATSAANLVGFAGSALSAISIISLLGSTIASAIGKQDEYNAVLAKFGNLIKTFFSSKASQSIEKGLLSISGEALQKLESVDPALKNIEEFRFSTKFLGVEIDVVKTKENLIKEVTAALTEAAQSGSKTFGEQLSDNVVGTGTGALLGKSLGAAVGVAAGAAVGAKFGATAGAVLGPVGAGVGLLVGSAIGFGISKFLKADAVLTPDIKQNLQEQYGAGIFGGEQGAQLEIALQKIEEQAGAAKNLSFEGRKYYEIQQALAVELTNNLNNIQQTQQIAERLGIDLAQLKDKFGITVDDSTISLDPTLKLDIPITLTVIDQAEVLKVIDSIDAVLASVREAKFPTMEIDPFMQSAEAMSSTYGAITEIPPPPSMKQLTDQLAASRIQLADINVELAAAESKLDSIKLNRAKPFQQAVISEISSRKDALEATIAELEIITSTKAESSINNLKNSFTDFASSLYTAQISTLQFESALSTLYSGVVSNTLNLETLAQTEGAVVSAYKRSVTEAATVEAQLAKLKADRAELLRLAPELDLTEIDNSIAALTQQQTKLQENITLEGQRLEAVRAVTRPYEEQLKVLDKIKKTFGDLVNEPAPKIGDLDAAGNYIIGEKNRQLAQYREVNAMINNSVASVNKLAQQEANVKNAVKGRADAESLILLYSNMTTESFAKQTEYNQEIKNLLGGVVSLNQEDLTLAEQYNTLLNVRTNITRQLADQLLSTAESVTTNLNNMTADLQQQITDLATQSNLDAIKFEIDMMDIKAQGEQAAFEFEQAFRENQIKLIELQVENKKIEPVAGAEQINKIEQDILGLRKQALDAELVAGAERYLKESELIRQQQQATIDKINLEADQTKAKIDAEYGLLVTAAETYSAISGEMNKAIIEGGNGAGRAIVDAAYAAAQTLASAFGPVADLLGIGTNIQRFAFQEQQISGTKAVAIGPMGTEVLIEEIDAIDVAVNKSNVALAQANATAETLRASSLKAAEDASAKEQELLDANYRAKADDLVRRATLLAQEKGISQEEAEKRLKDAADAGSEADKKLNYIEEKLQALFNSIKGNIENAIMGLNNLIFYGEGNIGDIMSNLFKSIQQDFFKTTVADPLSGFLTDNLFSMLGVENMRTGIENAQVKNGALLVSVVSGPADMFGIVPDAVPGTPESIKDSKGGKAAADSLTSSTEGVLGGFFDQITSLFTNIFGQNGFVSNLFKSLMGEGGILSGLFKGIGGFFSSLIGFSQGGLVHLAQGGAAVSASLNRDRIPAMLEPGEFVIRKQSAEKIGMPALQAMNATGGAGGNGNVFVNVTNEGSPKQADASAPRFDGEKYVVDIVMRDIANNGPIRRTLRGRGGL